jgi:hypothetical protein
VTKSDKSKFAKVLSDTLSIYNRQITADVVELWWRLFAGVPLEEIAQAADQWLRESHFAPTPADLLERCASTNLGHPDPESAWNLVPKRESDTAWVTQEMLAALAACQNSLTRGDLVAARMAFLECYRAQLQAARAARQGARPWLSTGCGLTGPQAAAAQEQASHLAMTVGLLPKDYEQKHPLLTHDGSRSATGLQKVSSGLASISQARKLSKTLSSP